VLSLKHSFYPIVILRKTFIFLLLGYYIFKMKKLNVLWISLESFSFPLDEKYKEKFGLLGEKVNSFVVAFSENKKSEYKYSNNTHFYLIPRKEKLLYSFYYFINSLYCLSKKIVINKNIDIIVCSDPFIPGFVGTILKKRFKHKKMGLLVEAFGDWVKTPTFSLIKPLRPLIQYIISLFSKLSISNADVIRAESDSTIKKMRRYNQKIPYYSFLLVHTELFLKKDFKIKDHKNKFYILFIGRIVKLKGLQYLIKVLKDLIEEFPELELRIGGEGVYLKTLKRLTHKLNLKDYVKFIGFLDKKEVKKELANCDLFVLPSMSEGTPKAIVEAITIEKPVIATKVGAINELIDDNKNGLLIEPGNIKDLKKKLIWALKNKDKTKEMGLYNRKILKKISKLYSIENYIDKYYNTLKKTYEIAS